LILDLIQVPVTVVVEEGYMTPAMAVEDVREIEAADGLQLAAGRTWVEKS
jgi:hypothetical protein